VRVSTIANLSTKLVTRELTAVEIAEASIGKIKSANPTANVFTQLLEERALIAATESDKRRSNNQSLGDLDGIPVAIKDNLHVDGMETKAGTQHDFSVRFKQSATVVQHLEAAGAVIVGKCSMDEAALGTTTNNPNTGQCYNPVCPGSTPGGSSGGSAAAVAAQFVPASLGTDTLGSVRIPAAYCHLWGFKPGQGVVSQQGLVPLCADFDCIGPLAHSAHDLRLMLATITGHSKLENKHPIAINTLRIGVAGDEILSACDNEVASAHAYFTNALTDSGVQLKVENFDVWNPGQLRRDGLLVTEVQAYKALEMELREQPESFSATFLKLMDYGRSVSAGRLHTSLARLDAIRTYVLNAFKRYDFLLLPTTPQLAFPTDTSAPVNQADYTALANVAGCPAVAFPIAINGNTRAASVQLLGPPGSDFRLLTAAEQLSALNQHT